MSNNPLDGKKSTIMIGGSIQKRCDWLANHIFFQYYFLSFGKEQYLDSALLKLILIPFLLHFDMYEHLIVGGWQNRANSNHLPPQATQGVLLVFFVLCTYVIKMESSNQHGQAR